MIDIRNFSKAFGPKTVVADLSFNVGKGEIFAFLGANGSGKTTTIRCLLGIYTPDAGALTVDGRRYGPDMSALLGYLPEERGLYISSKVLETMAYFGELKGMTAAAARRASLDYLERVDLADKADVEIKKLSSGQQQKIQLGITVINRPELLILDEPTKGLDPVNRDLLTDLLLELNRAGSTILFSTHQMEEAEKIADRLVMIKDGRRALYGAVDEVKAQFGRKRIALEFDGSLKPNPALYAAEIDGDHALLTPVGSVTRDQILRDLLGQDLDIRRFELDTPSLHEIFVHVSREAHVA
jgi:ABC-2 type transport system ATP-binding protein